MLLILENSLLVIWSVFVFSIPILLILPIIFANDSYD